MQLNAPCLRVTRERAGSSARVHDDNTGTVAGSNWTYDRDSYDLRLQDGALTMPRFGQVRETAVDPSGRLWVSSDWHLACVDEQDGIQVKARSHKAGALQGLALTEDAVWVGDGQSVRRFGTDGAELSCWPTDFRIGRLTARADGQVIAEGDFINKRLTVFDSEGNRTEGHNVVHSSVQPEGWLEKGALVRFTTRGTSRTPVPADADQWFPREGGKALVWDRAGVLSEYADTGKCTNRFRFGKNSYLRGLHQWPGSTDVAVAVEKGHNQQIRTLDFKRPGWLGPWASKLTYAGPRHERLQLAPAGSQLLLDDGKQLYRTGPAGQKAPLATSVSTIREDLTVPEGFPADVKPNRIRRGFDLRCAPIHHRFVLAHALGPALAAVTDGGKLLVSEPSGPRGYDLGSPPVAAERDATSMRLTLRNGDRIVIDEEINHDDSSVLK